MKQTDLITDPGALSPWLRRLLAIAQHEEKLLAAMREAAKHGDKDEVFRLAVELTRNCDQPAAASGYDSVLLIPGLTHDNCSDSTTSAFLES